MNKIEVSSISKIYKIYDTPTDRLKESLSIKRKKLHTDFSALSDISFTLPDGQILGIIGRNGAGKSTLLKIITGVLTQTSGEIKVHGRISSLLELGTGFNLEYSGIENIYFYGTLMGLTREEIDGKLDNIISFADIGDFIYQPVKTYSSGMFARLAFSCAINVDPDILIVDEILSVGDMRFQSKCFRKLEEFRNNGVTIIYVGHDIGMMRTFCDKVLWLNNGQMVEYGDPTLICAQYTEFMYLEDSVPFTDYKKRSTLSNEVIESDEAQHNVKIIKEINTENCLAHWGSNTGMVKSVRLLNEENAESGHFYSGDLIKIEIVFDAVGMDLDDFSVAFSIKNLEGTDLIVKTTYDELIKFSKAENLIKVVFELKPMLAKGEYFLVVALENRAYSDITYYEYIEGIEYFKIYSDKKIFGLVDVHAKVMIEGDTYEYNS